MIDRPKAALRLADVAQTAGWTVEIDDSIETVEARYRDGSSRKVETKAVTVSAAGTLRTYAVVTWVVSPHTDRWNCVGKRIALVVGNRAEIEISDRLGLLPPHVYWEPSLQILQRLLGRDPSVTEATLVEWNKENE